MRTSILYIAAIISFSSSALYSQWYQQHSGGPHILHSIFFVDENNGFAAGRNQTFMKTSDGGENWSIFSLGSDDFYHDMQFIDSQNGWAVLGGWTPARHGYILKTTNGGSIWSGQYYIDGFVLLSVYFINDLIGWAVGTNGIIFHTSNGGNSWTFQYQLTTSEWIYDVYFADQNLGWVVGNLSNKILKTTNGGNSWQWINIPANEWLLGIEFIDQDIGIAVGDNGRIIKSTNGGNTWFVVQSNTTSRLRDVEFVNSVEGWAVGLGGVILHTTNQGNTWNLSSSGTLIDLYSVSFVNPLTGWISGDNQLILFTNNGGIPVELLSFTVTTKQNEVELIWSTATELNNSGFDIERRYENQAWSKVEFVPGSGTTTEKQIYLYKEKPDRSGDYWYRLKQIDYDGTFEYSEEVALQFTPKFDFRLEQNYPNPFNPSTRIRFTLPEKEYTTLRILNSLGELVEELVNEVKESGNYEFEFDAGKLSSGMYFYNLISGEFIETKKMVLIK